MATPEAAAGEARRNGDRGPGALAAAWAGAWPKGAAVLLALLAWELVVASGRWPEWVLPGPGPVLRRLLRDTASGEVLPALGTTLLRAATGYGIAVVLGVAASLLFTRVRVLRVAFGSLLAGMQSMPSVAWFPLAILLFRLSEKAILFVVVLGAAPSIANGLLSGIDHVPPLLLRAGEVLGAGRFALIRHVVLPAALPGFVAGLKQGWAFAWRSLMAGELLVMIGNRPSLGVRLQYARELSDAEGLLASMLLVLLVGVLVDGLVFGRIERTIRERRGL